MPEVRTRLPEIMARHQKEILEDWLRRQGEALGAVATSSPAGPGPPVLGAARGRRQGAARGPRHHGPAWLHVRETLADISTQCARQGLSPVQTATFVFSSEAAAVRAPAPELGQDAQALADETWVATALLDALGLYTTEVYQKGREQVIVRQQSELLELSTPS
jgi:rsbT co-antagonist protein RsbR